MIKGGAAVKKGFKSGDLLAVGAVLLLAVLSFLPFLPSKTEEAASAQVYLNGELIMTVSLDRDQEFPVEGDYTNIVTVRDGQIAVTESDCPGQDCVHCGAIDSPGRSLVCLLNALEIRVVSGQSDVDFVVG